MDVQVGQYHQYIEIIKNNEGEFKDEILQYESKDALIQLRQLKNVIQIYEQNRERIMQEIKQVETALNINISDWKNNKMESEETISAVETWTPSISTCIEQMEKIEQNTLLILRIMDYLFNRLEILETLRLKASEQKTLQLKYVEPKRVNLGSITHSSIDRNVLISNSLIGNSLVGNSQSDQRINPQTNMTNIPNVENSLAPKLINPVCIYKPECQTCIKCSDTTLMYCYDKCVMCSAERKKRAKSKIDENPIILTNDKYFFIKLTSTRDDGTNDYIIQCLIKNFMSMFPESFPSRAHCYVIEYDQTLVPYLIGLIRYDSRGKYRISPKSTHIKNTIVSMSTGKRNLRFYDVQNLTSYADKRYNTKVSDIVEKCRFMGNHSQIIGNTENQMIANDS